METQPARTRAPSPKERLAFLEEAYRHTLESLELAASLGIPEGVRPLGTVKQILDETAARIKKLLKFKTLAFFLVREPGGDFYLARCHPPAKAPQMEEEMRQQVESGSAAWALQRKRPVFTSPSVAGEQLLLHSMATASRIRGIFLGILGEDIQNISDASLTLLTIVLRGSASLLEGLELYALLHQTNADLKTKLQALGESQNALKREIERRRKVEDALKHQALHDPLTGLPNRTLMLDRIQQAIRRSTRREGVFYAVAFLDLDKFKLVNDTLGHDAGDALLVEVGRRILQSVRQLDTVARFGGDEFVIFLEEISVPGEAVRVVKRMRKALAAPMDIHGHPVSVTGSIGLAFGPVRQATPDKLLKQANTAMHLAKEAGRNRVKVFSARMKGLVKTQASLLAELRRAIDAGGTNVLYVPIFSWEGRLTGFEALPAWTFKGTSRCGDDLVNIASREGVAWPLWLATLGKALSTVGAWRTATEEPVVGLTLKLDMAQPHPAGLGQAVLAMLGRAGLPGSTLHMEVSEACLGAGGEPLAEQLETLTREGVRLFAGGLGERFFGFHAAHPGLFRGIRIDSSRFPDLTGDGASALMGSLTSLARALGLAVSAVGLDGQEAAEQARSFECAGMRGDALSRPLSAGQARRLALGEKPGGPRAKKARPRGLPSPTGDTR